MFLVVYTSQVKRGWTASSIVFHKSYREKRRGAQPLRKRREKYREPAALADAAESRLSLLHPCGSYNIYCRVVRSYNVELTRKLARKLPVVSSREQSGCGPSLSYLLLCDFIEIRHNVKLTLHHGEAWPALNRSLLPTSLWRGRRWSMALTLLHGSSDKDAKAFISISKDREWFNNKI